MFWSSFFVARQVILCMNLQGCEMQKCCLELCATAAFPSCLEQTTGVLEQQVNMCNQGSKFVVFW